MWPTLIKNSSFLIYSYPLFMGLAWGIGYNLSKSLIQREVGNLKGVEMLFWGNFICSWIGAKLFFLLFSSGEKIIEHATMSSFWMGGGFVFYGGLIVGLIYTLVYSLILKKFEFRNLYLFVPSIAIGHATGRVGCLMAGCCYGIEADLPWSVHLHDALRHPVQLYEAIMLLILGFTTYKLIKSKKHKIFPIYLIGYSLIRFILEFFRGDSIRGRHLLNLSTSQYIAIGIFSATILVIIYTRCKEASNDQDIHKDRG